MSRKKRDSKFELPNEELRRSRQELELNRLNRTLKAHSHSYQALMRAAGEKEYMDEVCKIVVEDCGHSMVWIGFAEEDDAKTVRPVAYSGFEEGYLDTLQLTWADTERGRGPTGTSIRTGQPCMCRNMLSDPAFEPWRAAALKRGYASSLVLPLLAGGKAFGAISIYSREPDPFLEDEVKLLSELAGDLAYGIDAIRLRIAHVRAEQALRRTAEELARSNQELEQFAYVASHDLKEPLRMVTGFMSLLKSRCQGQLDDKADEYISFATEAATRMQELIDALLSYSRVGRGNATESVAAAQAVERALGNLQIQREESGAAITMDSLPTVQVNAVELTQVFQNLIGNALKFRRPDAAPRVHIGVREIGGEQACAPRSSWLFTVQDNGIGIDPTFANRIFMIFQRLHTRDEFPGNGVGLAICKKIVERHGGKIWVESEPGKGAAFCFTLPA
ncbi:MAG TPA: hypothetical protein DCZ95_01840 [Verrucomicrobia bacterium]|nr:hypothetical protein [Verrucomicrobiota bacterium]